MRQFMAFFVVLVLASSSSAVISVKGGLAGGAANLGLVMDRELNEKTTLAGEVDYGMGSGYSVMGAGVSVKMTARENLGVGAAVNYSIYSAAVNNGMQDVTDLSGVGVGAFAELKLRERFYGQVGYDTRLGVLAGVSYIL